MAHTSSSKPVVGSQPSAASGLRRVADEQVDLGGPVEALVLDNVVGPVEPDVAERDLAQLPHRVRLAAGDDVSRRARRAGSIRHIAST